MKDTKEVLKKKMAQYKMIAICGEAGSGKDSLAKALVEQLNDEGIAARAVVSYTTRPKRDYEIDGVDYHFVKDPVDLVSLILEHRILEATIFNDWVYATGIDDLEEDKINVAVLNPEGVSYLSSDERIDLCIIRCLCEEKIRIIRQLNREFDPDIDEIFRRLKADREDFSDFKPADHTKWVNIIHTDGHISISEEAEQCVSYIQHWMEKDN